MTLSSHCCQTRRTSSSEFKYEILLPSGIGGNRGQASPESVMETYANGLTAFLSA